jgi:hypothetical protein
MRKYRAYDEVTRGAHGLYVELGKEGEVASIFVTHGPVGKTMTREEYVACKLTPDFRSLPTKARIKPE